MEERFFVLLDGIVVGNLLAGRLVARIPKPAMRMAVSVSGTAVCGLALLTLKSWAAARWWYPIGLPVGLFLARLELRSQNKQRPIFRGWFRWIELVLIVAVGVTVAILGAHLHWF